MSLCKSRNIKIYPSIDLLNGKVVRLYQGSYTSITSYSDAPLTVAKEFEAAGARYLHVVDLDAARSGGKPSALTRNNRAIIEQICTYSHMEVQVGGGIRSEDDVRKIIDAGVRRLIIGTLLVKESSLVVDWIQSFDAHFIAAIDARNHRVQVAGWEQESSLSEEDLAQRLFAMGMKGIVYTSIDRDGTLRGPDIASSLRIAKLSRLPVTISGGMSSIEDCSRILAVSGKDSDVGIEGVIIGRALYEGKIKLNEAIRMFESGGSDNVE